VSKVVGEFDVGTPQAVGFTIIPRDRVLAGFVTLDQTARYGDVVSLFSCARAGAIQSKLAVSAQACKTFNELVIASPRF